jgi:hypothetical protein
VRLCLQNLNYTTNAFAALKIDGSIKGWGRADSGGANSPDDKGYTEIYSNAVAFAALKTDGSIKAWSVGALGASLPP